MPPRSYIYELRKEEEKIWNQMIAVSIGAGAIVVFVIAAATGPFWRIFTGIIWSLLRIS